MFNISLEDHTLFIQNDLLQKPAMFDVQSLRNTSAYEDLSKSIAILKNTQYTDLEEALSSLEQLIAITSKRNQQQENDLLTTEFLNNLDKDVVNKDRYATRSLMELGILPLSRITEELRHFKPENKIVRAFKTGLTSLWSLSSINTKNQLNAERTKLIHNNISETTLYKSNGDRL